MFDMLLGLLVMLALPGYLILQALLLVRYRNGWWLAAMAPLAIVVPLMIHAALALADDSNLWPLLMTLAAPFGFLYLCGLMMVRYRQTGTAFS